MIVLGFVLTALVLIAPFAVVVWSLGRPPDKPKHARKESPIKGDGTWY